MDAGRPGPDDSPRGESIFVTWSPKIFLEARDGAPVAFFTWFGMNNIRTEHVSPTVRGPIVSFAMISFMLIIAFISAVFGLWLMLPEAVNGSGFQVPKEIALFIVIALTVSLLKIICLTIKFKRFINERVL